MIAFRQFENHRCDNVLVFCLVFENTFSVTKMAFGFGKGFHFLIFDGHGFTRIESVFDFGAVSANILHRSSSYISRNERHIFQSAQVLVDGPNDEFVPVFASLTFDPHKIFVFLDDFFTFQINVNHQCIDVLSQKHIASTAQNKLSFCFMFF